MNTLTPVHYGATHMPRRFHPISLFAQVTSQQASGCLTIVSGSTSWLIYLHQGKLTFITSSIHPFDRLEHHLLQLSDQIPGLETVARSQIRPLFELSLFQQSMVPTDWLAIEWLFDQEYLTIDQVSQLIESLAQDVLESLLTVSHGTHELIDHSLIQGFPDLCSLELRPIVEQCHVKLRRQSLAKPSSFLSAIADFDSIERSSDVSIDPTSDPTSAESTPAAAEVKPIQTLTESTTRGSSTPESSTPESTSLQSTTPESSTPESSTPESNTPESNSLQSPVIQSPPAASPPAISSRAISLPTQPAPTVAPSKSVDSTPPDGTDDESTPSSLSQRYTIACIDDSPTVLQAINSFLGDENLSVVMINDPLKALLQVVRHKPDLILLDVGMPNLDGYKLCSMLRKHSSFKTTPIVMVTGHTGFIDRTKAKLVGASSYLTKPFTRTELTKMVFKYLT
jgi:two-component system, chemotaxis family, response regulator PixG